MKPQAGVTALAGRELDEAGFLDSYLSIALAWDSVMPMSPTLLATQRCVFVSIGKVVMSSLLRSNGSCLR